MIPFTIVSAVFGLAIGSFLNVIIDRVPRGIPFVGDRSYCPSCSREIAYFDLVPVLNYVWLRGRCRYCREPIPLRVPLVEALTGALFAWAGYQFGFDVMTAVFVLNACFFVLVFFIDLHFKLVLDKLLLIAFPIVLALYPFGPVGDQYPLAEAYLRSLGGTGLLFGIMLIIYLLWRGGMGAGDVKLAAIVGAATGYPLAVFVLLLAFIAGGAVSLLLIGLRAKGLKEELPFGSFLAVVSVAGLIVQGDLYGWYLNLFGL